MCGVGSVGRGVGGMLVVVMVGRGVRVRALAGHRLCVVRFEKDCREGIDPLAVHAGRQLKVPK